LLIAYEKALSGTENINGSESLHSIISSAILRHIAGLSISVGKKNRYFYPPKMVFGTF
jgi:hypothetical protein